MEKKNIDWSNLGFGYMVTDKRYVSMFKNGAWDDGALISDDKIVMSEDAGVLHYSQSIFEGLKAYTTEDGRIVCFRPDLNADRMYNILSCRPSRPMQHGYPPMAQARLCMYVPLCSVSVPLSALSPRKNICTVSS